MYSAKAVLQWAPLKAPVPRSRGKRSEGRRKERELSKTLVYYSIHLEEKKKTGREREKKIKIYKWMALHATIHCSAVYVIFIQRSTAMNCGRSTHLQKTMKEPSPLCHSAFVAQMPMNLHLFFNSILSLTSPSYMSLSFMHTHDVIAH